YARRQPTAAAWKFIEALLRSPGLRVLDETDAHAVVAARTLTEIPGLSGRHMHDAHVAILMREHGVSRIVTCDAGFRRFPFLEVVDPLSASWEIHEPRPGGPHPSAVAKYGRRPGRRGSPASGARGRR